MELNSCAITGHRPTRFRFKYNENDSRCKRLKRTLKEQFILLYEQGVHDFFVGGALGIDQWSGEILLRLKLEQTYQEIKLIVVSPYQNGKRISDAQDLYWALSSHDTLRPQERNSQENDPFSRTSPENHYFQSGVITYGRMHPQNHYYPAQKGGRSG